MTTTDIPPPSPHNDAPEPFPSLTEPSSPQSPGAQDSSASTFQGRLRSASKSFQESNIPTGMWIATGQIASSIPSIADIRRGSFGTEGWSSQGQILEKERRASVSRRRGSSQTSDEANQHRTSVNPNSPSSKQYTQGQDISHQVLTEAGEEPEPAATSSTERRQITDSSADMDKSELDGRIDRSSSGPRSSSDTNINGENTSKTVPDAMTTPFENGYQFPPKHTWTESTAIFCKAFWKFFITPIGFLVTIYGLNVVAWGGMLFLLLCNASPAMCKPTCNDINSPRRIWIEIDSQILNSLFCVTGFGTIPWRFRDLYYLMQYRLQKKEEGLRRLAGINRGWFRLEGSQYLPVTLGPGEIEQSLGDVSESSIPFPISKIPNAPLTGIRAPPTALWKLDFVIWSMVWNTFLQAVLSGFMWGFNRYKRPSWSTGLFVALACIVAACGGIASFIEGKHVKAIEGVPVSEKDLERLRQDGELGITHYNNIKDEKPKEKAEKEKEKEKDHGIFKRKHKVAEVQMEESTLQGDVR